MARQSFGGHIGSGWGYTVKQIHRNTSGEVSKWLSIIELLPEIHSRLITVQIDNKNWKDLLETYSGYEFNEEFIYLDPPYLPETRRDGKYENELTTEDHKELIDYLLSHKRRVMLSGYDNDLYQKLEKYGWKKICWEVSCSAVGRTRLTGILGKDAIFKKNQKRVECIWINYDLS